MSRPRTLILLLLIMALAGGLRLHGLRSVPPGLDIDEATNGNNASEALETGRFKVFYPENDGREGLFINLQALSLALFGREPWALRLVSAVFGTLTVLGMFLLAREIFRGETGTARTASIAAATEPAGRDEGAAGFWVRHPDSYGLVCAFLVAVSGWHLTFSRNGFRAISAPFFLTFGFYFLVKALRRVDSVTRRSARGATLPPGPAIARVEDPAAGTGSAAAASTSTLATTTQTTAVSSVTTIAAGKPSALVSAAAARPPGRDALLSGLFLGLGFHTYISYRLLPAVLGAALWLRFRELRGATPETRRVLLATAAIVAAVIALFAAPLAAYFLVHPDELSGRAMKISFFHQPPGASALNVVRTLGMFNLSGDRNWRHNIPGQPLLWWPVGIAFLAGIGLSVWNMRRRGGAFPFAFLLSWLGIMLVPNFLSSDGSPHSLRALVALPPIFLLSGLGVVWTGDRIGSVVGARGTEAHRALTVGRGRGKGRTIVIAAGLLLAVLHAGVTAYRYFHVWGKSPATAAAFNVRDVEAAAVLRSIPDTTPKYIVMNVDWDKVVVRGKPSTAQTMIFLLGGWDERAWERRAIHFIRETDLRPPPEGLVIPEGAIIVPLRDTLVLELAIRQRWPGARPLAFAHFRAWSL